MSAFGGWRRFFRLSESTRHREREVDDELHFHIDGLVERHMAEGMSEEEARRVVMARFPEFGSTRAALIQGWEKKARKERRRSCFDGLRQDLRVSVLQFRRRPGFSALAMLTLGLGIGASTTLFSVVSGVLLDPLPYPDSDQLINIATSRQGRTSGTTVPEFLALRARTHSLEFLSASRSFTTNTLLSDYPEQRVTTAITEEYCGVFAVSPVIGRAFTETDYAAGADRVALISHRLWQQRWGSDPGVLGMNVSLIPTNAPMAPDAASHSIVGVMPPAFQSSADVWIPLRLEGTEWEQNYNAFVFSVVGRLRPGARLENVQAEADYVTSTLSAEHPQYYSDNLEGRRLAVESLLDYTVDRVPGYRTTILLFFSATVILLIIAVANISGFLLVQTLNRRSEIAIRCMLGARRGRILRLLMTETLFLSLPGGAIGFMLALGGVRALQLLAPAGLPRLENLAPDMNVLFFTIAIALLSGFFCSLIPLITIVRSLTGSSLGAMSRIADSRSTARLRSVLVLTQMASATMLLIGGGLVANSLLKLGRVDAGIEDDGLLVLPVSFPESDQGHERYVAFLGDVVRQVRSTPGVELASWIIDPPMFGRSWKTYVRTDRSSEEVSIGAHSVGPDYFETMGILILRGRGIMETDNPTSELVVVVDEVMAERYWPSENPVGQRLQIGGEWFTIIGVAGQVHQTTLSEATEPEIYIADLQQVDHFPATRLVIRSVLPAEALVPHLRAAVWNVNPAIPIPTIETMRDRISADLRGPRFNTALLVTFALAAVFLTLASIYGLMLHLVTGRTWEIGIRMALGADSSKVLWMVSRQCLLLIGIGTLIGLGAAALTSRLLAGLLFGITPLDLPTYAVVVFVLGSAALLACLVPARRATRIDPTMALRWE